MKKKCFPSGRKKGQAMRYLQAARVQSRYFLRDTSRKRIRDKSPATDDPAKKNHIKLAPTSTAAVMDLAKGLR